MNTGTIRTATYGLTFAAGIIGVVAAASGYATYDAATGMLDPAPFNLNELLGWIAGAGTSLAATVGGGLAFLARIKGWGGK
jgi:hypothetical protein